MTTVIVLLAAVALIALVLSWSSRYGGRRRGGTSLRRGPHAHTGPTGRAKVAYASRDEAEARARLLASRDGSPMSVYRCATCGRWHVGHAR